MEYTQNIKHPPLKCLLITEKKNDDERRREKKIMWRKMIYESIQLINEYKNIFLLFLFVKHWRCKQCNYQIAFRFGKKNILLRQAWASIIWLLWQYVVKTLVNVCVYLRWFNSFVSVSSVTLKNTWKHKLLNRSACQRMKQTSHYYFTWFFFKVIIGAFKW